VVVEHLVDLAARDLLELRARGILPGPTGVIAADSPNLR